MDVFRRCAPAGFEDGMAEREGFSSAIVRILRQRKGIAIRPSNGSTCILSTVQTFSTATTLNIPTFPSNGMDSMDACVPSRPASAAHQFTLHLFLGSISGSRRVERDALAVTLLPGWSARRSNLNRRRPRKAAQSSSPVRRTADRSARNPSRSGSDFR
jgi:hypothetical protein